jgi:putative transposase
MLGYLADKHHDDVRGRMASAYACKDWREGEKALNTLAAWLTRINPDAAASLREGLEETLTVAKLAPGRGEFQAPERIQGNPNSTGGFEEAYCERRFEKLDSLITEPDVSMLSKKNRHTKKPHSFQVCL